MTIGSGKTTSIGNTNGSPDTSPFIVEVSHRIGASGLGLLSTRLAATLVTSPKVYTRGINSLV